MEKEAYYFPHFCNARHDRKIKRLRKELGVEGYGIYFMLLELLREQQDMRYPLCDVDLVADEFGTSEQKVNAVIKAYELFEIDMEEKFFSPKMLVYLEPYFRMKQQRIEASKKAVEARKALKQPTDNRPITETLPTDNQSKVKERKEKENKVKYINVSEFENISIEENKVAEFNYLFEKSKLDWIVKKLDSWLETKNKKCKGLKSFKAYCNNWVEHSYNSQNNITPTNRKIVQPEPNKAPKITKIQDYD